MLTVPIQFEDLLKVIDQLSEQEKRIISERLAENSVSAADNKLKKNRILGLHPGAFQPTDDFDDPLPDEFWLGEDA
ncbi:MAG: hypothetical protein ABI690_31930 [Chloroflexota bacterium]